MAGGSGCARRVVYHQNEEAAIVDTIKSVPTGEWCRELGFIVVDRNSEDKQESCERWVPEFTWKEERIWTSLQNGICSLGCRYNCDNGC